jgi:hypothetical protein
MPDVNDEQLSSKEKLYQERWLVRSSGNGTGTMAFLSLFSTYFQCSELMGGKWQKVLWFPELGYCAGWIAVFSAPRPHLSEMWDTRRAPAGRPIIKKNRREKYYERSNYHNIDDLLSQHVAGSERSGRKGDTYENGACARES